MPVLSVSVVKQLVNKAKEQGSHIEIIIITVF